MTNTKPCNQCPFRKTSLVGWLGTFESVEELRRMAVSETPFSCHSQNDNITDFEDIEIPQCVGRLLFATKAAKSFRNPELEELRLKCKQNNPDNDVMNFQEIILHHSKE